MYRYLSEGMFYSRALSSPPLTCNGKLIAMLQSGSCPTSVNLQALTSSTQRPHWTNTILLFHRIFEAHFLPAHLAVLIVGGSIYAALTPYSHIPILIQQALDATAYICMICLFNFTIFLFLYERYPYLCLKAREEEMIRAGLADRMYDSFSYRSAWKNWLGCFAFPFTGVLFGSIPALVALVCHFRTLSLVYKVSKKPPRMAAV